MFRPRALQPLLTSVGGLRAFSSSTRSNDIARLSMIGNIAIAPETQVGASGTPFVKYTIATHNGPRDAIRTSFWRVAVFEERQKQIVETLGKGSLVFVEADVELKPYESEDGKKHQYVSLFQRNINVIFRKNEGGEQPEQSEQLSMDGQSGLGPVE